MSASPVEELVSCKSPETAADEEKSYILNWLISE
jgi:hypothetical protein